MKAFVIYLKGHEHSENHANYMVETLNSYDLDAALFEGTPGDEALEYAKKSHKELYPYSIKNRILADKDVERLIRPELYEEFKKKYHYQIIERQLVGRGDYGKLSRPGVIGTFTSHERLWNKCVELNEPIMIFEDDVKFFRKYEPVEWDSVLILSLGKNSFLKDPWKSYLENPKGAPKAVPWKNFSMPGASGYAITPDAARALLKYYRPYWTTADNAINQFVCKIEISTHLMGRNTTEEEGNVSMAGYKGWINT